MSVDDYHNKDILLIEESKATSNRLKTILHKLGFTKVYIAASGAQGIATFKKLNEKAPPLVFLGFPLRVTSSKIVLAQILSVNVDTKVILETGRERSEKEITEIIDAGIYQFLAMPFGHTEITKIMQDLEEENRFFNRQSDLINMFQEFGGNEVDEIHSFFKVSQMLSLNRIQEYSKMGRDELIIHLKKLEAKNEIVQVGGIQDLMCSECKSLKIDHIFCCPQCKKSNFAKENLIEHYDCGNISPPDEYIDNNCPKCKKPIKIIGVDYAVLEKYRCNDCGEKFPDLEIFLLCQKCKNRFQINDASWSYSEGFKGMIEENK